MTSPGCSLRAKLGWLGIGFGLGVVVVVAAILSPPVRAAYEFSKMIYKSEVERYATTNCRGDKLSVTTDTHGGAPFKTIVKLRRARHWFATTLVTITSTTLWIDLRWRDVDHAKITISSDTDGKATRPIAEVGPIHIDYSLAHKNKYAIPHGYRIE